MAVMYPRLLPRYVQEDPKRAAERKVYAALERGLGDSFTVFFSVAWLSKRRGGRAWDGEADFVIAHPVEGILLLEVKGGRVGRDGATGTWASMDRSGAVHEIKNPFEQARTSKYSLLEKMKEHPQWRNRRVELGHGVVFPDCNTPTGPLGPDAPIEIVAFASNLDRLGDKAQQIFAFWRAQHGPEFRLGADGVKILTQLLAGSFELRTPLGAALADDDRRIIELTEQQFRVLDVLRRQRRVTVLGGAGSGKTLLALEKAKRLATEGYRVLLTCFNRHLADYLHESAGGAHNLELRNFHKLCYDATISAGVPMASSGGDRVYFERTLPDALLAALDKLEARYDAIVVDEAQDFLESWWEPLQLCLSDPASGVFYVFYDANQRIYRRVTTFPKDLVEISLSENLRNTKRIFDLANRFYDGDPVTPLGPDGVEVEAVAVSAEWISRETSRMLHRLIKEEEIPAEEIAVLCGKAIERSVFGQVFKIGAFDVISSQQPEPGKVLLQTIHGFKGLERRVVILTEIDDLPAGDSEGLLYVGITRARTHLAVVARPETLRHLGLSPGK